MPRSSSAGPPTTRSISLSWAIEEKEWGQIFILDMVGLRRASIQLLSKQTEDKVKNKDSTSIKANFLLICVDGEVGQICPNLS